MIKTHFSGRMVSSGISDVAFASVYNEIGKWLIQGRELIDVRELMEEIRYVLV